MSLLIDTGRLRQEPEIVRGEEPVSSLDLELGDFMRSEDALQYDFTVQCVSNELIVRGKMQINIIYYCSRCGDDFSKKILIPDFFRSYPLESNNELINLTVDVRENILLALPMVAVCSPECRGLCSVCGVNLNRKKCKCRRPEKKNVWGVLDNLHLSREMRGLK